jgi:hypothetical protein
VAYDAAQGKGPEVGIVSDLLHAQRRSSSQESRRLTEALDGALDAQIDNPDVSAVAVVDAAAAALQRTTREINAGKTVKRQVSEEQVVAFGDDAQQDPGYEDAEPSTASDLRTDAHFLPETPTDSDSGEDSDPSADDVAPLGHPAAGGYAYGRYNFPDQDDDDAPVESDDFDDTGEVDPAAGELPLAADSSAEAVAALTVNPAESVTDPHIPIPHFEPSPLDNFVELDPGFVPPTVSPPAAPPVTAVPTPSDRATTPDGDPFDDLEPDDELSFAERVRESLGAALRRVGSGDGRRTRWLVGGAIAALALVIVGIVSLSGNRGEAPVPAGTVAAPPAQTENPSAAPTAAPLVPKFVSASCVGDTDAVSLFAGEKSRAWVCGRSNGLDGSVLNITFNAPVVVTEITLVPGFNYVAPDGRDEWDRHRQVTGVTWRMGGQSFPQTINPTRTGTTMKFPSVITQEMSMTITASTRPAKGAGSGGIGKPSSDNSADVDETTAISSIVITGYPVDPGS